MLLSILSQLQEWDQWLFRQINSGCSNPVFDAIMPFMRNSVNWAPLYLFLLVFVILNFKTRGIWWAVFFLATVALTDMTGTYAFKHVFHRIRPCNDPAFSEHVRLVINKCAGGFSFISNHAANHFAMSVFFISSFRHTLGKWTWLVLSWAPLIAFAQVYIGVHYPLDVIAGALVGSIYGLAAGLYFNKRFGFTTFGAQPAS
ncbi:MAG: phosphatase PAP2 family protein [Chitinophagaceae bacterium]|nr:phosphatase PAP2 family protein [Chitinophagaceae bacterium]